MAESKIELTDRLRKEGRWSEASRFKDETLRTLRGEGMRRTEAAQEAWRRTAAAYPPLPIAEGPADRAAQLEVESPGVPAATADHRLQRGPGAAAAATAAEELIDVDAFLERVGDRQPPDLVRDVLWAYENLPNRKAKPENAPGLGAWSLLQWARQYRNRFFEQVLPKAMAARPPEAEENVREERRSIAEIEEMLGRLNRQQADKLAANVPETVRAKVGSTLDDWARRSAPTISSHAKADLQAHISRLVQDCLEALAPASGGAGR